ncbi:MAG: hypothetical protein D6758_00505 [Gammaproteobacteria bacterium]|nr:MAG: hypothetical protein D6758_00505 [Gammaproteobacteria bacterium]
MKIRRFIAFTVLSLTVFGLAHAQLLVLSDQTRVEISPPSMIAHSGDMLLLKYDNGTIFHEVVDPKTMYTQIDLTGLERSFIRSLFDTAERQKLPAWLAALSAEQADQLGVGRGKVISDKLGDRELLGVHDPDKKVAHLYLFETLKTHHLIVKGDDVLLREIIRELGGH